MLRSSRNPAFIIALLALLSTGWLLIAGDVNPPAGPVGDTFPTLGYKTLQQVEPRTPVNLLPGTAIAHHRIASPGSYYFTADIVSTQPGEIGILVDAANVSIDLCGFSLAGPGAGAGPGILVTAGLSNVAIRNGTIRDWGAAGIDAGGASACHVAGIRALSNGGAGISIGDAGLVDGCIADLNAIDGFAVVNHCTITDCTTTFNGGTGIFAFDDVNITNTNATGNGFIGVWVNGGTIAHCTINRNGAAGIANFLQALAVIQCEVSYNDDDGVFLDAPGRVEGCTVTFNGLDGIEVANGSTVINNTCVANGDIMPSAGIHVTGGGNRIEANNVTGQDAGIDCDVPGSLVIRNSSSGNTLNYDIVPGNAVGQILNYVGGGTISTSHAMDNIEY